MYVSPDLLHVLQLMESTEKADMYTLDNNVGKLDNTTNTQVKTKTNLQT